MILLLRLSCFSPLILPMGRTVQYSNQIFLSQHLCLPSWAIQYNIELWGTGRHTPILLLSPIIGLINVGRPVQYCSGLCGPRIPQDRIVLFGLIDTDDFQVLDRAGRMKTCSTYSMYSMLRPVMDRAPGELLR